MMKTISISQLLAGESFFQDMSQAQLDFIAGCASNVHFKEGEFVVLRGKPTTHFFLIRSGHAALEVDAGTKTIVIQTVSDGNVIGWSWVEPPYKWRYDVRVLEDISAIAFDAQCVRDKCEADPVFGYEMYKRFIRIVINRLMATRVQLTDMYS
jgi:CRP-like cAMP-binding protein